MMLLACCRCSGADGQYRAVIPARPPEPIEVVGCVERRPEGLMLRVVDPFDSTLPGETVRAASADASGGQTTHIPHQPIPEPFHAPTRPSSTANSIWLGSRVFRLASAPALTSHVGRRVRLRGTLSPIRLDDRAPVDQIQSAFGVRFRTVSVADVEAAIGSFPQSSRSAERSLHPAPGDDR
jgi:hypothetical protein